MTVGRILNRPIGVFGAIMGRVIRYSDKGSLRGIRSLVSVPLTDTDLPDSIIDNSVFVRSAELETYKFLNIADDNAYYTKTGLTAYQDNEVRDKFPKIFQYKSLWMASTRYSQNDIVYYIDTSVTPNTQALYLAKQTFTSGATFETNNWDQIQVNFEGSWAANKAYAKEDVVHYTDISVMPNTHYIYYANSSFSSITAFNSSNWVRIQSIMQTEAQRLSEERIKLAVQYLAAIKLIPALPQILEEQILRERVRYQEINWEKRIELYEQEVSNALEEETDAHIFADGTAVYGEVTQYLAL